MPCDTCCIACKLPFYYMSFNRNMKLYKQTKKQKKKLLQTEENVLRMIFKIDLKLFVLESPKCLRFKVRSFCFINLIIFFFAVKQSVKCQKPSVYVV